MKVIETLMTEHRLIEQVLVALERFAAALPQDDADGRATLARFARFIRDFADNCHHGKEEEILFATMEQQGFPRNTGPLAVMLAEHTEGRRLVKILREAADQSEPWEEADRRHVTGVAQAYIALLRQHIHKEDHILYPAAEMNLDAETFRSIEQRFDEFERKQTGSGEHERLHGLADDLITEFGSGSDSCVHHHAGHCH